MIVVSLCKISFTISLQLDETTTKTLTTNKLKDEKTLEACEDVNMRIHHFSLVYTGGDNYNNIYEAHRREGNILAENAVSAKFSISIVVLRFSPFIGRI